ncbi:MAG: archease [Ignavibacteria bacterium]|nr:archease [Ignavibacteria bacterium]
MFQEISHTADIGLYIESTSYRGLFYDAALGLMQIAKIETSNDDKLFIVKYKDNASDKEILLVNWLNFLINKLDFNYYLVNCYISIKFNSLFSRCYFKKLNKRELLIKSATFHNLKIIKIKNLIKTTIVFDV